MRCLRWPRRPGRSSMVGRSVSDCSTAPPRWTSRRGEVHSDLPEHDRFLSIVILHYLAGDHRVKPSEEWALFRQLPGGETFHGAFQKRVVDELARSFSEDPGSLDRAGQRLVWAGRGISAAPPWSWVSCPTSRSGLRSGRAMTRCQGTPPCCSRPPPPACCRPRISPRSERSLWRR